MNYSGLKIRKSRTYTHTPGRQLKIIFLDVLDHSEYSNTNISIFLYIKIASLVKKQKGRYFDSAQKSSPSLIFA